MSSCANCAADAIYTYQVNESFGIHYCQSHLPRFLYGQRDAGNLAFKVAEEAPKPSKKKAAPVEEVVEEVPVVEELSLIHI
jgi:hypothetical protein